MMCYILELLDITLFHLCFNTYRAQYVEISFKEIEKLIQYFHLVRSGSQIAGEMQGGYGKTQRILICVKEVHMKYGHICSF